MKIVLDEIWQQADSLIVSIDLHNPICPRGDKKV
jgi:hypothetical protein